MRTRKAFSSRRDLALEIKWSLGLDSPASEIENSIHNNDHLFGSYESITPDELESLKEAVFEEISGGSEYPFSRRAAILGFDSLKDLASYINRKHLGEYDVNNPQIEDSLRRLNSHGKIRDITHIIPKDMQAIVEYIIKDQDLGPFEDDEDLEPFEDDEESVMAALSPKVSKNAFKKVLLRFASGRSQQAALEGFRTVSGKAFKIQTTDFARFLAVVWGIRGAGAGEYLRGETNIPDEWIPLLEGYGAVVPRNRAPSQGAPSQRTPRLDIDKLWRTLVAAVNKSYADHGSDVADFFLEMPQEYETGEFEGYIGNLAYDMAQTYEYALSPAAEALHTKFMEALRSGNYSGTRMNLEVQKTLLREIAAEAWANSMKRAWEEVLNNPAKLARLEAMRATN